MGGVLTEALHVAKNTYYIKRTFLYCTSFLAVKPCMHNRTFYFFSLLNHPLTELKDKINKVFDLNWSHQGAYSANIISHKVTYMEVTKCIPLLILLFLPPLHG